MMISLCSGMLIYRAENSAIFIHAVQTRVMYNCNQDRNLSSALGKG
jgi:hypothetical protein